MQEEKPWLEGKITPHPPDHQIDRWLTAIDRLSKTLAELDAAKKKFKQKLSVKLKLKSAEKENDEDDY
jgi:hypothetical protein